MGNFNIFLDWCFDLFIQVWNLITSSWLLSLFVLIGVFGWIVDLINNSRSQ